MSHDHGEERVQVAKSMLAQLWPNAIKEASVKAAPAPAPAIVDLRAKKREALKSPRLAYFYALDVVKGRFLEGEPVIVKDAEWAYYYAYDVIKGRWPEAEAAIKTSEFWSKKYQDSILIGPWLGEKLGEKVRSNEEVEALKSPEAAYYYARNVIKGRWPVGEPVIAKDAEWAYWYARDVIVDLWPEGEPAIAKDAKWAYWYAYCMIHGRWPGAEPVIKASGEYSALYAQDVLKGPWPAENEKVPSPAERGMQSTFIPVSGGIQVPLRRDLACDLKPGDPAKLKESTGVESHFKQILVKHIPLSAPPVAIGKEMKYEQRFVPMTKRGQSIVKLARQAPPGPVNAAADGAAGAAGDSKGKGVDPAELMSQQQSFPIPKIPPPSSVYNALYGAEARHFKMHDSAHKPPEGSNQDRNSILEAAALWVERLERHICVSCDIPEEQKSAIEAFNEAIALAAHIIRNRKSGAEGVKAREEDPKQG